MAEDKKQELDFVVLSKVLKLATPYKGLLFFCLSLAVLSSVSNIRPYIVSLMVDDYIANKDMKGLYFMGGIFFAVVLLTVVVRYLFIYYSSFLGQSVIKDLRVKVFKHITSLRMRYFDQTPIGKVITRTVSDVQAIND